MTSACWWHRGDHRPAERRDADRAQYRGDVSADADELPVLAEPAIPGPHAADPCGPGAELPDHDHRRPGRHHGPAGPGRVPLSGHLAPDHAHVPAADPDLHAARPSRPGRRGPVLAAVPVVRRGPDVREPPGGGTGEDRAGDGPAVRPVRSPDDDLDPGPAGPFSRRRITGPRAPVLGRAPY